MEFKEAWEIFKGLAEQGMLKYDPDMQAECDRQMEAFTIVVEDIDALWSTK